MSTIWKIIRIIALYIAAALVNTAIAVTVLDSPSDAFMVLYSLVAPALFVWWFEKYRAVRANKIPPIMQDISQQSRTWGSGEIFSGRDSETHQDSLHKKAQAIIAGAASSTRKYQGWVPKGQGIFIAGRQIDGMVYVGIPPQVGAYRTRCRAYIDPSLSVASSGTDPHGARMPYWPGYSEIPAVCRATYLDWLAGGRLDGSVNPGYMFLFFYGLERRFMVDDPPEDEKQEIVEEVKRLKILFSQNNSVQRYLGEFLDTVSIAGKGEFSFNDPVLKQTILEHRGWELPFSLKFILGGIIAKGSPIDADWLHLWLLCHPERRLRTPAERCSEEFKALFKLKFDAKYPEGLKVRKPAQLLSGRYQAASDEFNGRLTPTLNGKAVPDISGSREPIQIAQQIADEAMDDLDKFSRYLGRNPKGRGSIEAHALLPAELRNRFPSDELDELKGWAKECVAAGGLVPVVEVIRRLEGAPPAKIVKRQLTGAVDALARLGLGMAPDPRFSLRNPKLDEPVVIFELGEAVEQMEDVTSAFQSELFQLALATFVAHSDGEIVDAEHRALRDRIESAADVTAVERRRLHAELKWYLTVLPDMSLLRTKLKNADEAHHFALRATIVAMAHADNTLQSEEVANIERIYKALGMDAGLAYTDLHAGEVSDGPVRMKAAEPEASGEPIPDEPKARAAPLDAARIAAIRTDTARVSAVLGEIFSSDEDTGGATNAPPVPSALSGLDPKHALLVGKLVQREHWSEEDLDELAGRYDLMMSGALETINEWAFEKFDDALLEEFEGYDVAPDIAAALKVEIQKGGSDVQIEAA